MKCSQCREEGHNKRNCPSVENFEITLSLSGGNTYKAEGKTVHEALDNLELSYMDIKTKGEIQLKKGAKKAAKLFYMRPLRRIVVNKLRKAQVGRDLEYLLK